MKKGKQLIFILSLTVSAIFSTAFGKVERSRTYKQQLNSRRPGITSNSVNKKLERAQILMSKGAYDKAISILKNVTESRRRPFEWAKAWQTLAYAYAQSEKYAAARKCLSEGH